MIGGEACTNNEVRNGAGRFRVRHASWGVSTRRDEGCATEHHGTPGTANNAPSSRNPHHQPETDRRKYAEAGCPKKESSARESGLAEKHGGEDGGAETAGAVFASSFLRILHRPISLVSAVSTSARICFPAFASAGFALHPPFVLAVRRRPEGVGGGGVR